MSNLEHDDAKDVKAPRTKRKYTRRKPSAVVAKRPEAEVEPSRDSDVAIRKALSGISGGAGGDCPIQCVAACCVITGDICGHPHKSGLQPMHKMKDDILRRYNMARQILIQQKAQ